MANKNVVIKKKNGDQYDNIYPKTTAAQVLHGEANLEQKMQEIDQNIETTNQQLADNTNVIGPLPNGNAGGNSVWDDLAQRDVIVKWFGNDLAAIQQAAAVALAIGARLLFTRGDYPISSKWLVDHPLDVKFQKEAKLVPTVGFTDLHAVEITSSDVRVDRIQVNGLHLPVETTPYDGTQPVKGVGVKVTGTAENRLENIEFVNGKIENTPFSAIHMEYVDEPIVDKVKTYNCSNNLAAEAPAVFTFAHCTEPKLDKTRVRKPGMKGISFSNCEGGEMKSCRVTEGNVGHAAYYVSNSTGVSIMDNYAKDGFGVKLSRGTRGINLSGNIMESVEMGFLFQGSSGVTATGNTVLNPRSDAFQVDVHPVYSIGVSDIIISKNIMKNNGDKTSTTQSGVRVLSSNSLSAERISADDNIIEGMAYGLRTVNAATAVFDHISFTNNKIFDIREIAISMHGPNIKITGNEIKKVANSHGISIGGNGAALKGIIELLNNTIEAVTGHGIYVTNTDAKTLKAYNNYVDGANVCFLLTTTNLETISVLANELFNGTNTNTLQIIGKTGVPQKVIVRDNYLPGKRIYFATEADIYGEIRNNESLATITNRPSKCWPYQGAGAPTITPKEVGLTYTDTTNKVSYISTGLTSADWKQTSA